MRKIALTISGACILVLVGLGVAHCWSWLLVKCFLWFMKSVFERSLNFWITYCVFWIAGILFLILLKND